MQIHQFQVSYVAEHDRILVRLNTTEGLEQRLWLTRRMLRGLYPHLQKASTELTLPAASPVGHDGAAAHAVEAFQREETLAHTDFATPFASQQAPLTADEPPLLVTQAHFRFQGQELLTLQFDEALPTSGEIRQMEITMGGDTVIALLHVIELALKTSDWGIGEHGTGLAPPSTPARPQDSTDPDSGWDAFADAEPPKYLN